MRKFIRNLILATVATATLAACSDEPFKPVGLLQDLVFSVQAGDTGEGQNVPFTVTLEEGDPSLTYTMEVTLDGDPLSMISGPVGDLQLPYEFNFPSDLTGRFALPPLEPGTHTLTVTITCGGQVWTKTITFEVLPKEDPVIHVTSISVPAEDIVLYVGEKKDVEIYAKPLDATDRQVIATVADSKIASVTQKEPNAVLWTVEGLKVGTTTVTCSCDGKEASFRVTVLAKEVKSIDGPDALTVKVGETETAFYTVTPEDAADVTLTGEILDTSVATARTTSVSAGAFVVTGVKVGSTTLVVTAANGVSKTTTVKVVEKTSEDIKVIDDGGQGGSGDIQDIKDITMKVGDSRNLKFVLYPEGVTDQSVTVTVSDPSVVGASGEGLDWTFTGLKEGEVTVTVRNGDTEKTFRIKVTAPDPTGINAPSSLTVTEGSSVEFSATRIPQNAAGTMEATTDSKSIATVTALGSDKFRVNGINPGSTKVKVFIGDVYAYVNITVVAKESPVISVTSITASPSSMTLEEGETGSFTVTVTPSNATDAGNISVKSNNTSLATVKYSGGKYIVTGVSAGTTTIIASCGGKTATVSVTVKAATVEVTGIHVPGDQTVVEGSTKDVSIYVTPTNATDQTLTVTSSSNSIAKIAKTSGNTYRITGVAEGAATITAKSSNGKTGTFKVTVTHKAVDVTSVSVNPTTLTLYEGETGDFTVTVTPSNADEAGNASASSSSTSIATVTKGSSGKFTVKGVKEGSATVTVTCGGKSAKVNVTVKKKDVTTYQSYLVVTLSPSSIETGGKATATVKKYTDTYVNGQLTEQDKTGTSVSASDCNWSSDKTSVATVSGGSVTGVAAGTATITATLKSDSGVKGSASITVKKPDDVITHQLSISPASASLAEGESTTFTAMYYTLTNGVKDAGTDVTASATWSVKSGTNYVTSNGKGKFTWKGGAGSATVQATYSGETATATVTTSAHIPVETTGYELELLGDDITVEAGKTATVNRSAKYYTIKYLDGVEQSRTPQTVNATLTSSAADVATISGSTVTGKAEGTAYLSGSYNNTTAANRIKVTVTAHVPVVTHRLIVAPSSTTIGEGESATLTATYYTTTDGKEDNGVNVTSSATWTVKSGSSYISSTSTAGKYSWKAGAGTATVQAVYEGESDTATIQTTAPAPVVTYELSITPSSATLNEGESVSLTATYYTITDGVKDSGKDVTSSASWSVKSGGSYISGTSTPGKYSWNGGAGTATVQATYQGKNATASITTKAHVPVESYRNHKLTLKGSSVTVEAGSTASVSRAATYSVDVYIDGVYSRTDTEDVTATLYSNNTSVATVSGTTVTGKAAGSTTLYGKYNAITSDNTIAVTVTAPGPVITHELVVTPGTATVNVGGTQQFSATYYTLTDGVRDSGTDVTSSASWSSTKTSVATVSKGLATAVAAGSANIKATYNGYTDYGVLTVAAGVDVTQLVVDPDGNATVYVGESVTKQIYVLPSNATVQTVNVSNGSPTYVSMSKSGTNYTFKGLKVGSSTVTASTPDGRYTRTFTITVAEKEVPKTLTITPSSKTINQGASATFTAMYGDQNVTNACTWTITSGSTYIEQTGNGVFTWKMGAGTATVKASYDGHDASATVKTNKYYRLLLYPTNHSLRYGQSVTLDATLQTMNNGQVESSTSANNMCSWSLSNNDYVTNDGGGKFSWKDGNGTVTVTASCGGGLGSASATCVIKTYYDVDNIALLSKTGSTVSPTQTVSCKIRVSYKGGKYYDVTPANGSGVSVNISDRHVITTTTANGQSYTFKALGPSSDPNGTATISFSSGGVTGGSFTVNYQCH